MLAKCWQGLSGGAVFGSGIYVHIRRGLSLEFLRGADVTVVQPSSLPGDVDVNNIAGQAGCVE